MAAARLLHPASARTGEGPHWDDAAARLLWVDLPGGLIHEARELGEGLQVGRSWATGENAAFAIPVNAAPTGPGDDLADVQLVVGGDTQLLFLREDGTVRHRIPVPGADDQTRLNDGKCDAQGRLWFGTRRLDGGPGCLWRLEGGVLHCAREGLGIPNGLGWSPGMDQLYLVDTRALAVDVFGFDPASGRLGERRRLISIEQGAGAPDGLCVDAQGCLWLALYLGGEVRRYSPTGALLESVAVAAPQVTSCGFAGRQRDRLVITTACSLVPDWLVALTGVDSAMATAAPAAPDAGALFVHRPGVRGLAAHAYQP